MNVLFLTLSTVYDLSEHDIYQDLMRSFQRHGHNVYVVTPCERRSNKATSLYKSCGCSILRVKAGNQSDCSIIEKGISTITIKYDYLLAINKYLKGIKFDLLLYTTPPVTLVPVVEKLKRKYACKTYLMLKDIFPQGAVDLGVMSSTGLMYKYFRNQESRLYAVSDYIGCMSDANVNYLISHNSISKDKIQICPNGIEARQVQKLNDDEKKEIRHRYGIPDNKIVLIYGGNLGKPQGIPFLMETCKMTQKYSQIYYLIVGKGTEYSFVKKYITENSLGNVRLIEHLPREEYFKLVSSADIGLICLNEKFTVPNVPSRILPYMENSMPVACIVDHSTDIGDIAESNGFGWKSYSGDMKSVLNMINQILHSDIEEVGKKGRSFLEKNYTEEIAYSAISSCVI